MFFPLLAIISSSLTLSSAEVNCSDELHTWIDQAGANSESWIDFLSERETHWPKKKLRKHHVLPPPLEKLMRRILLEKSISVTNEDLESFAVATIDWSVGRSPRFWMYFSKSSWNERAESLVMRRMTEATLKAGLIQALGNGYQPKVFRTHVLYVWNLLKQSLSALGLYFGPHRFTSQLERQWIEMLLKGATPAEMKQWVTDHQIEWRVGVHRQNALEAWHHLYLLVGIVLATYLTVEEVQKAKAEIDSEIDLLRPQIEKQRIHNQELELILQQDSLELLERTRAAE